MSIKSAIDWRRLAKHFLISFGGALLFGIAVYFSCTFFNEHQQGVLLIVAGGLLWCVCVCRSLYSGRTLYILAVAAGLSWGFLFAFSAAVSIQNGHLSVWWPTMIPALLLVPAP
jgi:hypothetical protein